MIKVLLVKDTNIWASHIAVSNIIKNIDKKFDCDDRAFLIYKEGDENYDIVYIHCSAIINKARLTDYRKKNPKSKLIAGIRGWTGYKYARPSYPLLDAVNAGSSDLLDKVKKHHAKAYLCHAGVDTDLFKPLKSRKNKKFTIGWVGNTAWALKNFNLLSKLGFPYKIATKPDQGHYHPYQEMPTFYNSIDALVLLSESEGSAMPVLEAGACGKPVISTPVGGAKEFLNDFQLVKEKIRGKGLDEMINKLKKLRSNPELRSEIGERNRRVAVEKWDWKIKVKQYEALFKGVL